MLFTSVVTGMMGATMTGFGIDVAGGPAGAFVAVALGAEFGKMVSKETKVDILVTPAVTLKMCIRDRYRNASLREKSSGRKAESTLISL